MRKIKLRMDRKRLCNVRKRIRIIKQGETKEQEKNSITKVETD